MGSTQCVVAADPTRVAQILSNLLDKRPQVHPGRWIDQPSS